MKTAELSGAALDYWVAKAEGWEILGVHPEGTLSEMILVRKPPSKDEILCSPSSFWNDGGEIIEREKIELLFFEAHGNDGHWEAQVSQKAHYIDQLVGDAMQGSTALEAAMRCYVASKFGDEVAD